MIQQCVLVIVSFISENFILLKFSGGKHPKHEFLFVSSISQPKLNNSAFKRHASWRYFNLKQIYMELFKTYFVFLCRYSFFFNPKATDVFIIHNTPSNNTSNNNSSNKTTDVFIMIIYILMHVVLKKRMFQND